MRFKITTDNQPRTEKPLKNEIGKISNNLQLTIETDINQFSELMGLGYTFSPSTYKDGVRNNKNWLEQQVLAFDFDNGVHPEVIIDRLATVDIVPNVIYHSFSHTPEHPKFRVVLVLDQKLTDKNLAKTIQLGMMSFLKDTDPACKDLGRMYFGGKKSEVFNSAPIDLNIVQSVAMSAVIVSDSGKTRKIPKSGLKTNSYNTIIEVPSEANFSRNQKWSVKYLQSQSKLFSLFMGGKWLTHTELFGMATSLYWLQGGLPLMRETMIKYNEQGKTGYTDNNFACLQYVNKMGYMPQDLDKYSTYEADLEHKNLVTAARMDRGSVEVVKEVEKISLEIAEKQMKNKFYEILDSDDTNIHIMKLPTGIGKTRLLETIPCTIALPTNALKDEVYERVLVKKSKTPTFPKLYDSDLNDKINALYSIGLDKVAIKLIIEISKGVDEYFDGDVEACNKYLKDLRAAYVSEDCVVTTHNRAVYSEFHSNTLVFDEDPLNTLLQVKSFNLADLISLEAENKDTKDVSSKISNLINYLRNSMQGVLTETPMMDIDIVSLVKESNNKIYTDLISVINSDYIIRDSHNANYFHYISRKDLPTDKKVIIMSATAPVDIYKKMYGDRVKVTDISNVEQKGEVIQITKKSCSRASLENNTQSLLAMMDTNLPTITFKDFIKKIPNAVPNMYFGNVSGYDELKGRDINIVGTPHVNNIVYMLIGAAIGIKMKPADLVMSYKRVHYGNYKFKFNCYDNVELMNIQLAIIEAELIQAVGRNRTLREDCKAYVYSNLPLSVSTSFKK